MSLLKIFYIRGKDILVITFHSLQAYIFLWIIQKSEYKSEKKWSRHIWRSVLLLWCFSAFSQEKQTPTQSVGQAGSLILAWPKYECPVDQITEWQRKPTLRTWSEIVDESRRCLQSCLHHIHYASGSTRTISVVLWGRFTFHSILFYSIIFYSIPFYSILFYCIPMYSIAFYSVWIIEDELHDTLG
jgi:hypothetical protein